MALAGELPLHANDAETSGRQGKQALLFEKRSKNFFSIGFAHSGESAEQTDRSFSVFFFKKELLPLCRARNCWGGRYDRLVGLKLQFPGDSTDIGALFARHVTTTWRKCITT